MVWKIKKQSTLSISMVNSKELIWNGNVKNLLLQLLLILLAGVLQKPLDSVEASCLCLSYNAEKPQRSLSGEVKY
jgi:hypothetical protein